MTRALLFVLLPRFPERTQFDIEGPRAALLMHDVPDLRSDRLRLDEELVRLSLETLPGPFEINYRVDHEIGHSCSLVTGGWSAIQVLLLINAGSIRRVPSFIYNH
jgi:hypothetical protein